MLEVGNGRYACPLPARAAIFASGSQAAVRAAIGVEGGGDIAFCSCDKPPISRWAYSSVHHRAAERSVLIQITTVLRDGGVLPLFWLHVLCGCVRPTQRGLLLFPSAGVARRRRRAVAGFSGVARARSNRTKGGRRRARSTWAVFRLHQGAAPASIARLLTPESSTARCAGTIATAPPSASTRTVRLTGQTAARFGRTTSIARWVREGARRFRLWRRRRRRYDHGRLGVGTTGSVCCSRSAPKQTRPRRLAHGYPLSLGPSRCCRRAARSGDPARATRFDPGCRLGAARGREAHRQRRNARGSSAASLQSAISAGPTLAELGAFEQGEAAIGACASRLEAAHRRGTCAVAANSAALRARESSDRARG